MTIPMRESVRSLDAYVVEPPAFEIILNANENPWDISREIKKEIFDCLASAPFNRYPDAGLSELRKKLADYTGIAPEQLIAGCGSDEVINMLFQAFVNPGETIVVHRPSFSMYEIWGQINCVNAVAVSDCTPGIPDVDGIIETARDCDAKMIFLCNPNNPTGSCFTREDLIKIIERAPGLVVLDEAYIEFADFDSCIDLVNVYPNVIVLRTLSKAFGLAGIRLGYAAAPEALINVLFKVKSPYNINVLTQTAAMVALDHREELLARVPVLLKERDRLMTAFGELPNLEVLPPHANFIYLKTEAAADIAQALRDADILVRDYGAHSPMIRLTVGAPEENTAVLAVFEEVLHA